VVKIKEIIFAFSPLGGETFSDKTLLFIGFLIYLEGERGDESPKV